MAINVSKPYQYTADVEVKAHSGEVLGSFIATYKQIKTAEYEELAEIGNLALFKAILTDLKGVQREDGKDLPFEEAVKECAETPILSAAVLGGYMAGNAESFRQKKKKPR
jgi:hypothetical protein